jgi:hypothetical protein
MLKPKRTKLNIKKILKNAPEAKIFWTADGKKLYNIRDLLNALKNMEEMDFRVHVTSKKNDFKEWIKLVIGDKKLARTLRWTTTLETSIKKIKEHLDQYYI